MAAQTIQPMQGPRTLIRSLTCDDLNLTLTWRNHPDTRTEFFHSDVITAEGHTKWYDAYLLRDDDHVFIIELLESRMPIAQTALYSLEQSARSAEFGRFMVGELSFRGSGYGREALGLTCRVGFEQFDLDEIFLEVKPSNAPAIRTYRTVGFSGTGETEDALTMRLAKREWQQYASAFSN